MRSREWTCEPLIPLWIISALLAVLLWPAQFARAQAPWPMLGGGGSLSGQSSYTGPQTPSVKWCYGMDDMPWSAVAPVVGAGGTVYCLEDYSDGVPEICAITANGLLKWEKTLPVAPGTRGLATTAAIAPDGTIYVAYDRLYAYSATGTLKWICSGPNGASTPVIGSNVVYFASGGSLVAVNPNGSVKWAKTIDSAISTPALGCNGLIAVSCGNKLLALDTTGAIRGTYTAGAAVGQPVIGKDGTIYFAAANNTLYAVSALGSFKWSKNLGARIATPGISASGSIYCGVDSNRVVALNSTGTIIWTLPTVEAYGFTAPAIAADGTIYIAANNAFAHLYAIRPNGTVLWCYVSSYSGGELYSAPAIGANGTVFVKSTTDANPFSMYNGIIAFQSPTSCTAWQPDLGVYVEPINVYAGNNIYNTSGLNQCITAPINPGITRLYRILIQNDGQSTTNFRLTANGGNSAWKVRYYIENASGFPYDITQEITTVGWTTPAIPFSDTLEIYAEVAMQAPQPAGSKLCLSVRADSYGPKCLSDLVKLTTVVPGANSQPDIMLSTSPSSTSLCGDNIVNTDGSNQVLAGPITPGEERWYFVRIQNEGTVPTKFIVSTPATANSRFAFKVINAAGQNLTSALCTAPYYQTGVVAPGGETYLTVVICASSTITPGQTFAVPLRVWSASDSTARDCAIAGAVSAAGTCAQPADTTSTTVGLN